MIVEESKKVEGGFEGSGRAVFGRPTIICEDADDDDVVVVVVVLGELMVCVL